MSCPFCSLQLPGAVAGTSWQDPALPSLQLPCAAPSQLCQGSPAAGARSLGASANRGATGCARLLLAPGTAPTLVIPTYLCVPSSLCLWTVNLGMKRGSSCRAWIQSLSELSPVPDTAPGGSVGSWARCISRREMCCPCRGSLAVPSSALPWPGSGSCPSMERGSAVHSAAASAATSAAPWLLSEILGSQLCSGAWPQLTGRGKLMVSEPNS